MPSLRRQSRSQPAAVEKSLAPGGPGSSPWWNWVEGLIFLGPCTQVQGPGVVSTGTRPPQLGALCVHIDRDMSATQVSEPPSPPPWFLEGSA